MALSLASCGGKKDNAVAGGDITPTNTTGTTNSPTEGTRATAENTAPSNTKPPATTPPATTPSTGETTIIDKIVVSLSKPNALAQAKAYLSFSAFSYEGLIHQLELDGFTHEQAVYGVTAAGF